jgi:beta-mannanase
MNWAPFAYNVGQPYDQYYPGDDYVDIVGIDLYVEQPGGTMSNTVGGSLFDQIYNKYSGKKPFMIMETNKGPRKPGAHFANKADYYNDFVGFLNARPKISGVVFFDQNKWDGEGADMAIAKTPGPNDYNAANMNAFVNMAKNCHWGTDTIQAGCNNK